MRRLIFFAFTIFLLSGAISYAAEAEKAAEPATSAPLPVKIGVVDMQVIATESDAAKAAREEMEKKYGKEKENLEKKGADLKIQAENLKKNSKATEQKRIDFIKTKQKLDKDTQTFLRKVEQDEIKLRQEMVTLVFNATYEVAKAQGYTFVVDVNAGGVIYAERSMDLTAAVLEEANKLYKKNKDKAAAPAKNDDAAKPAAK